MTLHKIRKGLDLPLSGAPEQVLDASVPTVKRVGIMGDDFHGMKPRLLVSEGDRVKRGQVVLEDKTIPGVRHTAPGSGVVSGINRGRRRVLQSIVITLSEDEVANEPDSNSFEPFRAFTGQTATTLPRQSVVDLLIESGLWTAFRTRPFSRVPAPETVPDAIFVNAMDTNPLAPLPERVLAGEAAEFNFGLEVVSKLTKGSTFLCTGPNSDLAGDLAVGIVHEEFDGPHPAGTTGLHIHFLHPVSRHRTVWTIGYQDVVSIARLFQTGILDVERVISVGGPPVKRPRLVRTRVGASVEDILSGDGLPETVRRISGSVLSGKAARGDVFGYMGRYDLQITAVPEGSERQFLGWLKPGGNTYSILPAFIAALRGNRDVQFSTSTHGSQRAIVPMGLYERVMPFDIMATFLLRSLMAGDHQQAEQLGCLELDEEDLALCTFVCPGKIEYGPALRNALRALEEEV